MEFEIIIVGGGLSGSQTLCEFLEKLIHHPPPNPIRLCMIDEGGHFGRGYAYGAPSPPEALLIEAIGISTPTGFQDWLADRAAASSNLTPWEDTHRSAILAGEFLDLHCPRHLFGDYQELKMRKLIAEAERSGIASIALITGLAVDLQRIGPRSYLVVLAQGQSLSGSTVILAIGAIPRKPNTKLAVGDGYIEDPYSDGYRSVRAALSGECRHLIIIGSNASAIELIHIVESSAPFSRQVAKITTVSREGYLLPGTISSRAALEDVSAATFPSATSYLDSARSAVGVGRLATLKGIVADIRKHADGLEVQLEAPAPRLVGQLVVNCGGAGRMHAHSSALLDAIQGRRYGIAKATGRGFEMIDEDQTILGLDSVHVVGPLLNGDGPGSYVESILTVYASAHHAANAVFANLPHPRLAEGPSCPR